ncbi:type II toxin-antitoxin system RelE/ParE family toxin [Chlorobium ferrooxidans]|uniref:Plasmid stabilization system n=1 Tax=Chlorobium ferrooxidans DSM 13031 TaxID=377431 RepID=Q0YT82_9CHLB|nr:type II toxin-antitoxin system RelE/ParE family toxin [Chlorobium ferrooxidans]EAT59509.1 Plasmid stabilization system [Chlorobium ferrooxidans DSM 13031]
MNVEFSERAARQITDVVRYIAADKPAAAKKWADSVKKAVRKLSDYPHLGRVVPEFVDASLRELLHGEYRIVYKIDEQFSRIVIVAVYHARRILMPD